MTLGVLFYYRHDQSRVIRELRGHLQMTSITLSSLLVTPVVGFPRYLVSPGISHGKVCSVVSYLLSKFKY